MIVESHAFRMQLKPGTIADYKRRHDEIWPELAEAISAAGIYDYSIFLDEKSLALFAIYKVRPNDRRKELASLPVMRRWWDSMAPLMEVEPGNRPREWPLTPMFHLA
jgi:L-rhamnose mutarotase